ncbi:hypothetical protein E4V42_16990 [Clostridium estertheticum]|uniref:Uncharacterized protein n=1 Tax=Clostridium estertheticum TaxID=238834 RepID=A0A5N7J4X2_9CLOT|nr:hypothetical protein [Clostridium estertheticum]MPQ33120.1 hypothetical protein [Clostridium estertheticum]MPQ63778.1 hypothetical protein [Clostridium estertheticum]
MDYSKLEEVIGIGYVCDVSSAKKGIIDFLSGEDTYRDSISKDRFNSYKKGREIAVEIENILNENQRDY